MVCGLEIILEIKDSSEILMSFIFQYFFMDKAN